MTLDELIRGASQGEVTVQYGEYDGYDCMSGGYVIKAGGQDICVVDEGYYKAPAGSGKDADRLQREGLARAKNDAILIHHALRMLPKLVDALQRNMPVIETSVEYQLKQWPSEPETLNEDMEFAKSILEEANNPKF